VGNYIRRNRSWVEEIIHAIGRSRIEENSLDSNGGWKPGMMKMLPLTKNLDCSNYFTPALGETQPE